MPLPPNTKVRDVDRIEVSEAFADSIKLATFDGHNVRITFCVHRYDDPRPPNPPSAEKVPTCRLVLSPDGVVELFNALQNLLPAMTQSGVVQQNTPSEPGAPPSISRH